MSSYYFNSPPSDAELGIGFAYSLFANCVTFIVVSYITFKRPLHGIESETLASPTFAIRIKDLTALTQRVLDPAVHEALVNQLSVNISDANSGYANHTLLQRTEKLLSAQVGTPSARILLGAITETKNDTLLNILYRGLQYFMIKLKRLRRFFYPIYQFRQGIIFSFSNSA